VVELRDGEVRTTTVDPAALGIAPPGPDAIAGGDAAYNANAMRAVLEGEPGARRDIVLLNAAAGLVAAGAAGDLGQGLQGGSEAVDSGAAIRALDRLVEVSNSS
jgi:anthranilate phosphoribosyltransferase